MLGVVLAVLKGWALGGGQGGPPTLQALTLGSTSFTAGRPFSTAIAGLTPGSTVTVTSSDGTALTVSGSSLSGTFASAGSLSLALTETLAGASNSPRVSLIGASVTATPAIPANALLFAGTPLLFGGSTLLY